MKKRTKEEKEKITIKYSAVHCHTRGQAFDNPNFSAHFGAFCMATGRFDNGNYSFELQNFLEHIKFYFSILSQEFSLNDL